MKTTKYKSVKNRKRAVGSNQRVPFIPSKGGYMAPLIAPESTIAQTAARIASRAFNAVRRPFRRQSR